MAILIEWPLLALLPLALFLALFVWSLSRVALVAALLWALYVPYELAMKHRILCSGECNIRIDLLVIYPLLIVTSALAVVMAVRAGRRASAP
ncbi:MAG TPA: hypothetical protein VFG78_05905 [Gemmatimonadota bacterium]|nr:hypothetical protein [Gemmatimonadota bacterium]